MKLSLRRFFNLTLRFFRLAVGRIVIFIYRNLWAVLFYMFLLSIVTLFQWGHEASLSINWHNFSQGLRSSVMPALCLGLFRGFILISVGKKKGDGKGKRTSYLPERLLAGCLTTILVIASFVEVWMSFSIHTRWSDRIIRLILDTNQGESSEFMRLYLLTPKSIGLLLGFLLFSRIIYVLLRHAGHLLRLGINRWRNYILIGISFICLVAGIWWWSLPPENDFSAENNFNTLLRLHKMINVHKRTMKNIKALEKTPALADGYIPDGADAPTQIIWVIGESDSRAHWNLYGYYLPTTPRMNQLQKEGNLLKFDDVICFEPRTYRMMEILFSPYVVTDSTKYYLRQPLTPMILRKAGYLVRLHDNQATLVRGDDQAEVGTCNFMNSLILSRANFDYRNEKMYRYDMDLIEAEASMLRELSMKSEEGRVKSEELRGKNKFLDIFHLNGQHFFAVNRYPEGFGIFTEKDYSRPDLTPAQVREVAAYDNATLYVDSVLMRLYNEVKGTDAVIIYHPDHGEEVNDQRACAMRTMDSHKLPVSAPYVLEIPFIVMTTPEFREAHPLLYDKLVKAASQKQSLIYFSHFLMDLAGVESKYKKPQYSPLSAEWSNPPRVAKDIRTYDVWKEKNNVKLQIRTKK